MPESIVVFVGAEWIASCLQDEVGVPVETIVTIICLAHIAAV